MRALYDRAKSEADYNANISLRMLGEHGGLETARRLVMSSQPSEGFTQLWLKGRLDLTVESLVLEPQGRRASRVTSGLGCIDPDHRCG
jgi:hypothetical protein